MFPENEIGAACLRGVFVHTSGSASADGRIEKAWCNPQSGSVLREEGWHPVGAAAQWDRLHSVACVSWGSSIG